MLDFVKPEQVGVSSKNITRYLQSLEQAGLSSHAVIMMRHGKVFFEKYWAPFHKDFPHRMYSVTKSFVAIAIGALYTKGLIDLDKPFVSYYPEYEYLNIAENLKKQKRRSEYASPFLLLF